MHNEGSLVSNLLSHSFRHYQAWRAMLRDKDVEMEVGRAFAYKVLTGEIRCATKTNPPPKDGLASVHMWALWWSVGAQKNEHSGHSREVKGDLEMWGMQPPSRQGKEGARHRGNYMPLTRRFQHSLCSVLINQRQKFSSSFDIGNSKTTRTLVL